ncbi:MAG: hypothetical protein WDO19_20985 [Bacteroidota bacterium]
MYVPVGRGGSEPPTRDSAGDTMNVIDGALPSLIVVINPFTIFKEITKSRAIPI